MRQKLQQEKRCQIRPTLASAGRLIYGDDTMAEARREAPNALMLWWWRRLAHRRQIVAAALDLHDRYGSAARSIARNTARRGTHDERRYWRKVGRKLRLRDFGLACLANQRSWSSALFGPRISARPDMVDIAIGAADMAADNDRR